MRGFFLSIAIFLFGLAPVGAEPDWQLSIYSGLSDARSGDVSGTTDLAGAFVFATDWSDMSFDEVPYLGARLTRWIDSRNGLSVDVTNMAFEATATGGGVDKLSFAEGLTVATLNWMHRFDGSRPDETETGRWQPYFALGIGVAIPDVEVETARGTTRGRQFGGPAAVALVGLSRRMSSSTALFAEYKLTHARLDIDLDGEGDIESDLTVQAINFGVSVSF